jgi:hypothetical protein
MVARLTCVIAVAVLLLGPFGPQARADDYQLVDQWLQDHNAVRYTITPITDEYVTDTLPGSYFGVYFQQWPQPILPPQGLGLAPSNVFFVIDGAVFYLTNADDLEGYFLAVVAAVQSEREARDVGRSWLRLSAQFSQDGYYTFSGPSGQALTLASGAIREKGKVRVLDGGSGYLKAVLDFDASGVLTGVHEKRPIRSGVRPICQATKLLDADPLVRRIAEQDILVMGRAAKAYLDEQRARATPELRQAIDLMWKRIVAEGR